MFSDFVGYLVLLVPPNKKGMEAIKEKNSNMFYFLKKFLRKLKII